MLRSSGLTGAMHESAERSAATMQIGDRKDALQVPPADRDRGKPDHYATFLVELISRAAGH